MDQVNRWEVWTNESGKPTIVEAKCHEITKQGHAVFWNITVAPIISYASGVWRKIEMMKEMQSGNDQGSG